MDRWLAVLRLFAACWAAVPMVLLAHIVSFSHVSSDQQLAWALRLLAAGAVVLAGYRVLRPRRRRTPGRVLVVLVALALLAIGALSAVALEPAARP